MSDQGEVVERELTDRLVRQIDDARYGEVGSGRNGRGPGSRQIDQVAGEVGQRFDHVSPRQLVQGPAVYEDDVRSLTDALVGEPCTVDVDGVGWCVHAVIVGRALPPVTYLRGR